MPEEMIDLLRPDGTPLGCAKPKSQIHRDGDLHRTAHLWIVTHDLRVLLQLRASTKVNHPSLWDISVAGHVDAGESAQAAAIREAREELGIELAADELRHVGSIRERWVVEERGYVDNEVQEVFIVRRDVDLEVLALQPGEVDDVALVSFDEFRGRVARRDVTMVGHWEEYERVIAVVVGGDCRGSPGLTPRADDRGAVSRLSKDAVACSLPFAPRLSPASRATMIEVSPSGRVCREETAMPLIGTFETMPIPELLQWIGMGRKTGTLQVTTDKGLAVLAFEDGEVIFSASSDRDQTLSKLLMEAGVLTDEVHQQARAVCRKTGIGLGKALTDLNVLRESELLALMRRKVENELLGLLQTEEGRFQFIDDELPDLELLPMRVDVTKTLLRVTQRMDEGEGFDHTDPDA